MVAAKHFENARAKMPNGRQAFHNVYGLKDYYK